MPRRVPEVLAGIARRGAAGMPHVAGGAGSPFRRPPSKLRNAGSKRHTGVVSFGYFSLDKQRKVSRLPVRELALKAIVALATHYKIPLTLTLSHKGRGDNMGFRQVAQVPYLLATLDP